MVPAECAVIEPGPVFILGLSGRGESPPQKKKQKSPQKFKMNYAKIEFLSISGVIFSPASGGFAPDPHRDSAPGPDLPLLLNCTTFG